MVFQTLLNDLLMRLQLKGLALLTLPILELTLQVLSISGLDLILVSPQPTDLHDFLHLLHFQVLDSFL